MGRIKLLSIAIKLVVIATIPAPLLGCTSLGVRLPTPGGRVISGHERCTPAANSTRDCGSASNSLCRANAFVEGITIDTQTEYCLEGTHVSAGCVFVTRAVCH